MKRIAFWALIALYLLAWWITWTGMLANLNREFEDSYNRRSCRERMAFAMGWSLNPFAPLMAPFMTGFYEDGFQDSCVGAPLKNKFGYEN
jgi:hypothetical protein